MSRFCALYGENNRLDKILFREPRIEDADVLLDFGNQLLTESDNYIRAPDERANDVAQMAAIIRSFQQTPNHVMLHAWERGVPVGEAVLIGGHLHKCRLTATVGLGILNSHQRMGLGTKLLVLLEERARELGLHRLELTVLHTNPAARRLYGRMGYRREGVKLQSVLQGHRYVDEIMMAKLLT